MSGIFFYNIIMLRKIVKITFISGVSLFVLIIISGLIFFIWSYHSADILSSIKGNSMLPSIGDNEVIKLKRIKNNRHYLGRGDIVFLKSEETYKGTEDATYLKRIVGLPGEEIALSSGYVYINNKLLIEDYLYRTGWTFGRDFLKDCQVFKIPEGEYFVMGDNRELSRDSRDIGPIEFNKIEGVVKDGSTYNQIKWTATQSASFKAPLFYNETSCKKEK